MSSPLHGPKVAASLAVLAALPAAGVAFAGGAAAAPAIATPYGCNSQVVVSIGYTGECARAAQWTVNAWIARTGQKISPLAVSGSFDATTSAVVKKFQSANGVPATGVIDAKTWPALIKEATTASSTKPGTATPGTPTAPSTPTTPSTPATPPASTASNVARVTIYPTTNVRSAASTSSSIVGTLKSGTSLTGTLANGWLKVATPTQYAGRFVSDSVLKAVAVAPTSPPTSTPAPMGRLKTPFACTTRPTLTLNSTGDCVKASAFVLNSWAMKSTAGLSVLPTDGRFTVTVQNSLKAFQKAQGLPQSGSVDAATWRALETASLATGDSASITGPTDSTHDHRAFPGAVKLADGRLMAVYRQAGQHMMSGSNLGTLWKVYSPDNGYSWTAPQQIAVRIPGTTATSLVGYTDPGLSVAKSGQLAGRPMLTFFTRTYSSATDTNGSAVAWISVAQDASGTSWGTPQLLDFTPGGSEYVSSSALQLGDDSFLTSGYGWMTALGDSSKAVLGALSISMLWNGQQFANAAPTVIARPDAAHWMTEPNIERLQDGRILALVRQDNDTAQARIYQAYSSDGGKTWSPYTVAFEGSGNPHFIQLQNGTLVVSYRHVVGGTQKTPVVDASDRYAVYRTSKDNGATWSNEVSLGARSTYEMTYSAPVEYAPNKVTFVWGDESKGGNVSNIATSYVDFN